MPEFRTSPDGGIEVRLAGSRRWKAVSPEEAEAYGMGRLERMGHSFMRGAGQIDEGGALLRSRLMEGLLGQTAGMPEGTTRDEYQAARQAEVGRLQAESAAMGRVDPRAGLTAFGPEVAGGIGVAAATGGAGLPAVIGAETAFGAGVGAALDPEHPGRGALIGGGLGAAGGVAGPALSAGARRGMNAAGAVIDRFRGEADLFARGSRAADVANRRAAGRYRPAPESMGAAANPDVPPGQRPLEGFLTADDAADVGIPLTRGDRMALDAADREAFEVAAQRRAREELARSSELGDAVFTKVEETRQAQRAWLTSRIASELGDPQATNLTPRARQRIRGDVQDTFKKYFDEDNTADLTSFTPADQDRLQEVVDVATPNASGEAGRFVSELKEHITAAKEFDESGFIDGPDWYSDPAKQRQYIAEKRTELANKAEKAFAAGNYELGSSLSQIKEVVEDVLQRQYAGDKPVQQAITKARERWRILKALERANAVDPAGDLNVRSFLNAYKAVTPRYKRLTRGSRGDLETELETLNWLTTKVQPDSGTAQRLIHMLGRPLPLGGGTAAAGYLGGSALFGD